MKLLLSIFSLAFALSAQAADFSGNSQVTTGILAGQDQSQTGKDLPGSDVRVRVQGAAAKALFDSLNITTVSSDGLVQTAIKRGPNIICRQSILGDNPATMTGPSYNCEIEIDSVGVALPGSAKEPFDP